MHKYQDGVCPHCLKIIDLENDSVELDHSPAIFKLKYQQWDLIKEKFHDNLDLEPIIKNVHSNISYRLLHKNCNQNLGKIQKTESEAKGRELKKSLSSDKYQSFKSFEKDFTYRIKKLRTLNSFQVNQILFQLKKK